MRILDHEPLILRLALLNIYRSHQHLINNCFLCHGQVPSIAARGHGVPTFPNQNESIVLHVDDTRPF